MSQSTALKLGLIGDNIAASWAPLLHRLAGRQSGIDVTYDRLVPKDMGMDFDALFDHCTARGYRGINVTYPYKERAAARAVIDDPLVRRIGAVNTVLFGEASPRGLNTDHTGFIAAYRALRPSAAPGVACLIGAGGVGRALAFGLQALGASEIRLFDTDAGKARRLAADLTAAPGAPQVTIHRDPADVARGACGILNATPIGMVGYEGTPIEAEALSGAAWAFDAVYTPVETRFLQDARGEGLSVISGYELFIHQGIHAWRHFSGRDVDEARLRTELQRAIGAR